MADTSNRRGRILALGLALVVLTAGCSSLGLGDSGPQSSDTGQSAPGSGQADSDAGQSDLDRVTSNQSAALDQVESFTIEATSRVRNESSTVTTHRTVRVDTTTESVLAETRLLTAEQDPSLREAMYATGDVVYSQHRVANTTFYDRQSVEDFLGTLENRPSPDGLSEQFDFERAGTDDGDHVFVADSLDQYRGDPPQDGTVENVSARVRVDTDTGLVTSVRLDLVVSTADQRTTYSQVLEFSKLGETTVPEPDWLETAKERTE